ncbi:hypothetical protein QFZ56_000090 [Streptomyces achromogenes]|uniref:Transposase n=1 Tax=Streptomyces achromogenes TaxID=67255 RepID=A0ABU0PRV3_STRAH|nr:hypothetical protein [Streptomyces achromogenes]
MTAWRRLRDWTEAGVWPCLHAALLSELRRADLLDLDDCAVDYLIFEGAEIYASRSRHSSAVQLWFLSAPRSSNTRQT